MSIEIPLYRQEKDNTCALACLRMALAGFGTDVEEATLEAQANLEPGGTEIGELARLARQFGLAADVEEATVEQVRQLLAEGKQILAYVDRAVFDLTPAQRAKHSLRNAKLHVVVPTRVTGSSITYHDPLPPRVTRRSLALFRSAYERLGSRCVVCAKEEGQT
jgi:beta-phosphoglucomutase-like phosphatase (HAD superfamily)